MEAFLKHESDFEGATFPTSDLGTNNNKEAPARDDADNHSCIDIDADKLWSILSEGMGVTNGDSTRFNGTNKVGSRDASNGKT